MRLGAGLNQRALSIFQQAIAGESSMRIKSSTLDCGATVLDFGVNVAGGLEAGLRLASVCMAGQAEIDVVPGDRAVWSGPWVQVSTEHPVEACMLSQYAGWPVKHGDFFAMGSGSMRVRRGREPLLESLGAVDSSEIAVGTLECDQLPSCELVKSMAAECFVGPSEMWLAVAPTRSIAGCVQVVARSVETALHKLHELGFPLEQVHSSYGIAPLPPPTPNFAKGIGRTNDAILYGAHVTLWVSGEDEQIASVCEGLPSNASKDFGSPFAEIFKQYDYDFYKVDPGLFSPAEVVMVNLKSGRSWRCGNTRPDLIAKSFETATITSPSRKIGFK
jgi:methenyltetrahydromethanopterin cyclohydrolase